MPRRSQFDGGRALAYSKRVRQRNGTGRMTVQEDLGSLGRSRHDDFADRGANLCEGVVEDLTVPGYPRIRRSGETLAEMALGFKRVAEGELDEAKLGGRPRGVGQFVSLLEKGKRPAVASGSAQGDSLTDEGLTLTRIAARTGA